MTTKQYDPVKIIAIVIAVGLLGYFVIFPAITGAPGGQLPSNGNGNGWVPSTKPSATPTSEWWAVSNLVDDYHDHAVDLLVAKWGVAKKDWGDNLDWTSRNLILVGGSEALSIQASWIRTPAMAIVKPGNQPNVFFSWHEAENAWTVETPTGSYDCNTQNDIGFITSGYDSAHNRYIYTVIGWSGHCTVAGALMLKNQLIAEGHYAVYQLTGAPASEPWNEADYTWTILESG